MARDGTTLKTFGERGYRVALETRPDESFRIRWYVGTRKLRKTIPGLRHRGPDGTVRLLDLQEAERIGLQASQSLERGEEPSVAPPADVGVKPHTLRAVGDEFIRSRLALKAITADCASNYRASLSSLCFAMRDAFDLNKLDEDAAGAAVKALAADYLAREPLRARDPEDLSAAERKFAVRGGPIAALKAVSLLYTISKWACGKGYIDKAPVRPIELPEFVRRIWEADTKSEVREGRPRHELAEAQRLHANLRKGDLRLKLLEEVAFGTRLGQARLLTRRDVNLVPDAIALGTVNIRGGSKRKRGTAIDLDSRSRLAVDEALSTWLAPWEAAFQAGKLENYYLIPAESADDIESGMPLPVSAPISESHLGSLWDALEATAGLPKVEGRRWYGIRRLFRDLAASETTDTRVLDRLMGHNSRGTGGIYEDKQDPTVRRRAMEVRAVIWEKFNRVLEET